MAFARDFIKFTRLGNLNDFTKLSNSGSLNNVPFIISVRTGKHYNPKFKWLRGKKFIEPILKNSEKEKEQFRYILNNMKLYPRYWKRRMVTITSAGEIMEPYEPPEGDGKVSNVSKGALEKLKSGSKTLISDKTALRKIKNHDKNFQVSTFQQEAQDIYVKAHTALMSRNEDELFKYFTENVLNDMLENLKLKTVRWKFIESLEPPKVVQSRVQEIFLEKNLFAQITVRFHTKQSLAIYDRFGRLMYGSEIVPKDVLEYVVFEKHINNLYGVWKIVGKIIPEWKQQTVSYPRTYRIEEEVEVEDPDEVLLRDFALLEGSSKYKSNSEVAEVESKTTG